MQISKPRVILAILLLLALLSLTACGKDTDITVNINDIPEEKIALENFLSLYFTVNITHNPPGEDGKEKTVTDLLTEYNILNKEEKIAYLRNMITEALAANEDIGGIDWQMNVADRTVKEIFPDLYTKIAQQHKQIKTNIFSYDDFTYHVITNENDRLTKVVEFAADGSVNSKQLGGADQVIAFPHNNVEKGTVKITTDSDNKVKSVVYVRADGEVFDIYDPNNINED